MTIKNRGGVFGRNPTFNDVNVDGTLSVGGTAIPAPADTLTTSDIGSTVQAYDADTAKLDIANEFSEEQSIRISDATAYNASAADAQITVGPSLFLSNPANTNATVGGQVVFGLRSTPYYARLGATGGSNPNIFVGLGTSEIARFTSSGLALSNGNGIDFSATAGTGTSELFSDYEEGLWTPTQGTFGTWTSPTFDARYTKIGNVVSFSLRQTGGTIDPDGAKKAIGGLPYAVTVASSCAVSAGSGSWDLGSGLIWTDETVGLGLDVGPQTALVIFGQYITG